MSSIFLKIQGLENPIKIDMSIQSLTWKRWIKHNIVLNKNYFSKLKLSYNCEDKINPDNFLDYYRPLIIYNGIALDLRQELNDAVKYHRIANASCLWILFKFNPTPLPMWMNEKEDPWDCYRQEIREIPPRDGFNIFIKTADKPVSVLIEREMPYGRFQAKIEAKTQLSPAQQILIAKGKVVKAKPESLFNASQDPNSFLNPNYLVKLGSSHLVKRRVLTQINKPTSERKTLANQFSAIGFERGFDRDPSLILAYRLTYVEPFTEEAKGTIEYPNMMCLTTDRDRAFSAFLARSNKMIVEKQVTLHAILLTQEVFNNLEKLIGDNQNDSPYLETYGIKRDSRLTYIPALTLFFISKEKDKPPIFIGATMTDLIDADKLPQIFSKIEILRNQIALDLELRMDQVIEKKEEAQHIGAKAIALPPPASLTQQKRLSDFLELLWTDIELFWPIDQENENLFEWMIQVFVFIIKQAMERFDGISKPRGLILGKEPFLMAERLEEAVRDYHRSCSLEKLFANSGDFVKKRDLAWSLGKKIIKSINDLAYFSGEGNTPHLRLFILQSLFNYVNFRYSMASENAQKLIDKTILKFEPKSTQADLIAEIKNGRESGVILIHPEILFLTPNVEETSTVISKIKQSTEDLAFTSAFCSIDNGEDGMTSYLEMKGAMEILASLSQLQENGYLLSFYSNHFSCLEQLSELKKYYDERKNRFPGAYADYPEFPTLDFYVTSESSFKPGIYPHYDPTRFKYLIRLNDIVGDEGYRFALIHFLRHSLNIEASKIKIFWGLQYHSFLGARNSIASFVADQGCISYCLEHENLIKKLSTLKIEIFEERNSASITNIMTLINEAFKFAQGKKDLLNRLWDAFQRNCLGNTSKVIDNSIKAINALFNNQISQSQLFIIRHNLVRIADNLKEIDRLRPNQVLSIVPPQYVFFNNPEEKILDSNSNSVSSQMTLAEKLLVTIKEWVNFEALSEEEKKVFQDAVFGEKPLSHYDVFAMAWMGQRGTQKPLLSVLFYFVLLFSEAQRGKVDTLAKWATLYKLCLYHGDKTITTLLTTILPQDSLDDFLKEISKHAKYKQSLADISVDPNFITEAQGHFNELRKIIENHLDSQLKPLVLPFSGL